MSITVPTFTTGDGNAGRVPKEFGPYTLHWRMASGGMANVYLGHFTGSDGFTKRVAIKIIHDHLTEHRKFIEMFIDEARLVARISHPNVAQVLDLGSIDGRHFIAMEYINGESLASLARRTPIPPCIIARIGADAAAGLHAAHELCDSQGHPLEVVHRDVSPHNIVIGYDGTVKLIDFGVAKARYSLHESRVGSIKGKLAYMSPEQIRREPIDRRTDIFALGIILYEVSVRRSLFRGKSEAETVDRVLHKQIIPPAERVDDYPAGLEQVILKALKREAPDRYQTAEAAQEDLERYLVASSQTVMQRDIAQLMAQHFAAEIRRKARIFATAEKQHVHPVRSWSHHSSETQVDATEPLFNRRNLVALAIGIGVVTLLVGAVTFYLLEQKTARSQPSLTQPIVPPAGPPKSNPMDEVTISVSAEPAAATIYFAGTAYRNPLVVTQPATGGQATIRVTAPGHIEDRFTVNLAESSHWELTLQSNNDRKRRARRRRVPKAAGASPPTFLPKRAPKKSLFDNPYGKDVD